MEEPEKRKAEKRGGNKIKTKQAGSKQNEQNQYNVTYLAMYKQIQKQSSQKQNMPTRKKVNDDHNLRDDGRSFQRDGPL